MVKAKPESSMFVRAVEFVSLAQKRDGAPYQRHIAMSGGYAVAFDGVLAAGHPTGQDIIACPQGIALLDALKRAKGPISVSQLDTFRLAIKAGRFRAFIDCLPGSTMPGIFPDAKVGLLTDAVREGLLKVSPFIAENSPRVALASALLRSGSVMGTNAGVIVEYWHGVDLPPEGFMIPKTSISAICKVDKKMVGFGFSPTTLTIWYEDESWLRTQLYKETWPDISKILNVPSVQRKLPDKFFDGLDHIASFAEGNKVTVAGDKLTTHNIEGKGADFDLIKGEGVAGKVTYNLKHLQLLSGYINTIDFVGVDGGTHFRGDNLRGAICQLREKDNV